jgi:cyclic-di-AMP phosphodiesterase PgpH
MPGKFQESGHTIKILSIQAMGLAIITSIVAELVLTGLHGTEGFLISIARMLILFISLYLINRFAYYSFRAYKPRLRDSITMCLLLVGSVSLIWVCQLFGLSLASYFEKTSQVSISSEALVFVTPYATASLIMQAILGLHHSVVLALNLSLIIAIYLPGQSVLVPYVLCSCLVGSLSISKFRSRSAYTGAAFYLALIAIPFALSSVIFDKDLTASDISMRFFGAALNGILCSSLAAVMTPIFEYLGGYVTDMRLIEMATLDHPLLKELSVQAPGTWNHSMVMGMMAESAANAIGANSIIARVGAYFHDIGKIKKPLYFAENQSGGENRHDKLSTSMSALIIRSHVKDGIDLARKHSLPEVIEDMIPQHHGTSLIEYFYDKACKEAKEAGEDPESVDQSLYIYPGPRPQTKEAGILMLADGIEAASRTIGDPNPDRVQGLVQKMINKVFASGELDECELTLKDLHAIAKSFTHVLAGIYHQRIAYAEPAEKTSEKALTKAQEASTEESSQDTGHTSSNKKARADNQEKLDKEESKGDLKRLGME